MKTRKPPWIPRIALAILGVMLCCETIRRTSRPDVQLSIQAPEASAAAASMEIPADAPRRRPHSDRKAVPPPSASPAAVATPTVAAAIPVPELTPALEVQALLDAYPARDHRRNERAHGIVEESWLLETTLTWKWVRVSRTWREGDLVTETAAVADSLVVALKEAAAEIGFLESCKARRWTAERLVPDRSVWRVQLPSAGLDSAPLGFLVASGMDGVARVEMDDLRFGCATIPNDPNFSQQWALHNTGQTVPPFPAPGATPGVADSDIDAPEAWDEGQGTGEVVVAVLDTGIDFNHPDLATNIWLNAGETGLDAQGRDKRTNGEDDDGNQKIDDWRGWNFVAGNNLPIDDHGHGTHVAGVIGAVGNNGQGVAGVAWGAKLMAVKFMQPGPNGTPVGARSAEIAAVDYASRNGAAILNCSYAASGTVADGAAGSQTLAAYQSAQDRGCLIVAGSGNNGRLLDRSLVYPACYKLANLITVAATDHRDALLVGAGGSNFSATYVHIAAPGFEILSTIPGSAYGRRTGTSMACAFASGAAALAKRLAPNADPWTIRDAILRSGDSLPGLIGRTVHGRRLNLAQTLGAVLSASGPFRPHIANGIFAAKDGTVWTWGDWENGPEIPVRLPTLQGVASLVQGDYNAFLKFDGSVMIDTRSGPGPQPATGLSSVSKACVCPYLTPSFLFLREDGSVWIWLGTAPPATVPSWLPAVGARQPGAISGVSNVADIAANAVGICLLGNDGVVRVLRSSDAAPVAVPHAENHSFTRIFAGEQSNFWAVRSDGSGWEFLRNALNGSWTATELAGLRPPRPGGALPKIVQICGANASRIALLDDGRIIGFGPNEWGSLGLGHEDSVPIPVELPAPASRIGYDELYMGDVYPFLSNGASFAIAKTGQLMSWGWNGGGMLGRGFSGRCPAAFPMPVIGDCIDASEGGSMEYPEGGGMAAQSNGQIWIWGRNPVDGSFTQNPVPAFVFSGVKQVEPCDFGAWLLLKSDGTLWYWGLRSKKRQFQVPGVGPVVDPPQQIQGLPSLTRLLPIARSDLAIGHTWGLTSTGHLWGLTSGFDPFALPDPFGLVEPFTETAPALLHAGLPPVSEVTVASDPALLFAVDLSGAVWAWGWDDAIWVLPAPNTTASGRIPDGLLADYAAPTLVPGMTGYRSVAVGLGLKTDGTFTSWLQAASSSRLDVTQLSLPAPQGIPGAGDGVEMKASGDNGDETIVRFSDGTVFTGNFKTWERPTTPGEAPRNLAGYRVAGIYDITRVKALGDHHAVFDDQNRLTLVGNGFLVPNGNLFRTTPGNVLLHNTLGASGVFFDEDGDVVFVVWAVDQPPANGIFTSPMGYFWWLQDHFPVPDPKTSSPDADPDGDGTNNAGEYALDSDPNVSDPPASPDFAVESFTDVQLGQDGDGEVAATYRYLSLELTHPARSDVFYAIEASQDLENWVPAIVAASEPNHLRAFAPWPIDSATPRAWLRLRMTLQWSEDP